MKPYYWISWTIFLLGAGAHPRPRCPLEETKKCDTNKGEMREITECLKKCEERENYIASVNGDSNRFQDDLSEDPPLPDYLQGDSPLPEYLPEVDPFPNHERMKDDDVPLLTDDLVKSLLPQDTEDHHKIHPHPPEEIPKEFPPFNEDFHTPPPLHEQVNVKFPSHPVDNDKPRITITSHDYVWCDLHETGNTESIAGSTDGADFVNLSQDKLKRVCCLYNKNDACNNKTGENDGFSTVIDKLLIQAKWTDVERLCPLHKDENCNGGFHVIPSLLQTLGMTICVILLKWMR